MSRKKKPGSIQELFPTHPTYQNPIFINPRPLLCKVFLNFRFFSFSAYWTPIGPLLDPKRVYAIGFQWCPKRVYREFICSKGSSVLDLRQYGENNKRNIEKITNTILRKSSILMKTTIRFDRIDEARGPDRCAMSFRSILSRQNALNRHMEQKK